MNSHLIRYIDFGIALIATILLVPLFISLLIIGWFDSRSPLYRQVRLGRHQHPFTLIKFRSMRIDTISVATHEVAPTQLTGWGAFLRRTKLDELPQLWNVIRGDMSLVGPRPNLPTQTELIQERHIRGVYAVRPGVTGLSQLNGIDMSTPVELAECDALMISTFSFGLYLTIVVQTLLGRGRGDRIRIPNGDR